MNKFAINDLAEDIDLDREALRAIVGSGFWGKVKKYARKTGRYVKRQVKRKISTYRQAYELARKTPIIFYRGVKSGLGLW